MRDNDHTVRASNIKMMRNGKDVSIVGVQENSISYWIDWYPPSDPGYYKYELWTKDDNRYLCDVPIIIYNAPTSGTYTEQDGKYIIDLTNKLIVPTIDFTIDGITYNKTYFETDNRMILPTFNDNQIVKDWNTNEKFVNTIGKTELDETPTTSQLFYIRCNSSETGTVNLGQFAVNFSKS